MEGNGNSGPDLNPKTTIGATVLGKPSFTLGPPGGPGPGACLRLGGGTTPPKEASFTSLGGSQPKHGMGRGHGGGATSPPKWGRG